jgi:hypothetical protein
VDGHLEAVLPPMSWNMIRFVRQGSESAAS